MIDLEKLSKEHEKLFPNATAESQLWKLEEEINELKNAETTEEEIKETADIIIVCCGLYRWFPLTAQAVLLRYWFYTDMDNREWLDNEVNRKWRINLKRKWKWNGKTYHHVEE